MTLTLTWNPPPHHTQNGNITQYLVNISASETRQRFRYMTDGATTITLSSLHPDYVYSFTVAAVTSAGVGPYATAGLIQMPQDGEDVGCTAVYYMFGNNCFMVSEIITVTIMMLYCV